MPGKVKVKILSGRNLPIMDRSNLTTDAYVEIKLGSTNYRTEVYRKSLNPVWNSEWFRFEMDDLELQDEPLQIRLMDHDTYSSDDAIGKVYLDLNPLLCNYSRGKDPSGRVISGWFPIYDTMHGIRGEVNLIVKVELFSDFNKFRQSSCGVRFFFAQSIPDGYVAHIIQGFVEELVVNDDPEYQWIDKIRTPRASNEARQTLFSKLSGEVQRRVGLKALELGGNAVMGYKQCFDLEGESGIVVRGIGTAVYLTKQCGNQLSPTTGDSPDTEGDGGNTKQVSSVRPEDLRLTVSSQHTCDPQHSYSHLQHVHLKKRCNPSCSSEPVLNSGIDGESDSEPADAKVRAKSIPKVGHQTEGEIEALHPIAGACYTSVSTTLDHWDPINWRGSGSELVTSPKLCDVVMVANMSNYPTTETLKAGKSAINQYGLMGYPFITISQFPPGFLTHIGGTVTARSVKLLERISNLDEPESRDAWWNEIRMEIRAHCRAFGCTVVVGYEEQTTICEDVCVLSASGTAAIAITSTGLNNVELLNVNTKHGTENSKTAGTPVVSPVANNDTIKQILGQCDTRHDSNLDPRCATLHIPSNPALSPFPAKMPKCNVCRKGRVPDVLLVTVDIPPGIHTTGKGTLIQSQVFRPKKDCKGEISAKEVSDVLPFLEYELHRKIINKLKVKGMNAIFGMKVQICLGDKLMVAVATGTAMYVTALPPPGVPIIAACNLKTDAQKVIQYQKVIQDAYDKNRQLYELQNANIPCPSNDMLGSSGEESDNDERPDFKNDRNTYLLEVDDTEDIDIISMLIDQHPSAVFFMNNIDYLHGYEEHQVASQQMFTHVWRHRIPTLALRQFSAYFERLLRSVCFKLRKMTPCVLTKLSFQVDIPEQDEIQIVISGLALGMSNQLKGTQMEKSGTSKSKTESTWEEKTEVMCSPKGVEAIPKDKKVTEPLLLTRNESIIEQCQGTPSPSRVLAFNPSQIPCTSSGSRRTQSECQLNVASSSQAMCQLPQERCIVEITPLSYLPGQRIEKYIGNLNFFFIRETTSTRESGGLNGFVHTFMAEILAIVRAHVRALGGNAMTSYFMTELALYHNPHKNQGQCLINIGGDVVSVMGSDDSAVCD